MKKIDREKIKTWFVTGASSGVGNKICLELLKRGYNVIAVSRRVPNIEHENILCLSVDVTKPDTIQEAINKGIEKFGRIDVLLNNAGISSVITCEEETLEHMKNVMETNFFGTFNTINMILPYFRKNSNGTIINNTSMHGLSIRYGGSAYCSSKFAIEGLSGVCKHECQKFCRFMSFELGFFAQTDVTNNAKIIETRFEEYKYIPSYTKKIYNNFINQLDIAIPIIIDQVEQEKLPRRLILGKDAYIKVKSEIEYLRKDLKVSKKRALKCAKFNKEFPRKVLKKIANYIKENLCNNN